MGTEKDGKKERREGKRKERMKKGRNQGGKEG